MPVSSGNGLGDDELVCYVLPPLDAACAAAVAIGCYWLLLVAVAGSGATSGGGAGDFGASVFRSSQATTINLTPMTWQIIDFH